MKVKRNQMFAYVVGSLSLLAPGHVASIEVARKRHCALAHREFLRDPLRVRVPHFFIAPVPDDALDPIASWL